MKGFLANFWHKLVRDLGLGGRRSRVYRYDETLIQFVQDLATREQRPAEEIANELLSYALIKREKAKEYLQLWETLSLREQQVAALACQNYTNRQIAERLRISTDTVKSHLRSILHKLNLHSKVELALALSEWDFSDWLEP